MLLLGLNLSHTAILLIIMQTECCLEIYLIQMLLPINTLNEKLNLLWDRYSTIPNYLHINEVKLGC